MCHHLLQLCDFQRYALEERARAEVFGGGWENRRRKGKSSCFPWFGSSVLKQVLCWPWVSSFFCPKVPREKSSLMRHSSLPFYGKPVHVVQCVKHLHRFSWLISSVFVTHVARNLLFLLVCSRRWDLGRSKHLQWQHVCSEPFKEWERVLHWTWASAQSLTSLTQCWFSFWVLLLLKILFSQ